MKSNQWTASEVMIGGHQAVRNTNNLNKGFPNLKAEYEVCLPGNLGEIWPYNGIMYSVGVISHLAAYKIAKILGMVGYPQPGDECLFRFHGDHLKAIIEVIDVHPDMRVKIRNAETFNKRSNIYAL